jgi:hypothetical protein
VSNAGIKLREPVIGDDFDLETYGRPSSQRPSTGREASSRQRAQAPAPGVRRARRIDPATVAQPSDRPTERKQAAAAKRERSRAEWSEREHYGEAGVRTVKIQGQATPARRRPAAQIVRYDQHPDRAAQWALFLGVFMVVIAIVTGT